MPVPQPDIKDIFRIPLLLLYFAGIAASVLWDYRDPVPAVTRISGLRLLLCLSPAMIVSAISAKRHSRLVRHQKWSAAMQTDESPYYAPLYRKPTHTAKYRADALFEQDILQVKGRETYLLMRRVTADTVDFCTVPYEETPVLPETVILHDGEADSAVLTDIRAFADADTAHAPQ